MSLFDFLKAKSKPFQQEQIVSSTRPECDIAKTYEIAELFKIPRPERDDQWRQDFYSNVATASFACDTPQTLIGPDGFTYFILRTPEPDKPFESFCIQNMKDDFLLHRGWGIVFNPALDKTADWVFTYGDIVNLHLNNHFISVIDQRDTQNIEFTKNTGTIRKEEQVMIAHPSETYLPISTRAALSRFLQSKGIKNPKVMMITSQCEGKVIRKLAFNIAPENYPETTKLDHLMQQVGWFLPNDYILVPISQKSSLAKGFHAL